MWKDIKNWEEYYEVSDLGEVRNKTNGHLLAGDINSAGYYRVCLYNKNHTPKKQRFFRHRLVAEHFIENPDNLPEVNHIDGILSHNHKLNLEWATRKENELHSRKYGNKEYKPFAVAYENGETVLYDTVPDFAKLIGITPHAVKCWLSQQNQGYLKRGIINISYINSIHKSLTTSENTK